MNPILPLDQLVLLFLLLAGVGIWSAWRSSQQCRPALRWLLLTLRLAALTTLLVIALNPGEWKVFRDEETSEWAVLLDSSASMATRDVGGSTRWTQAARIAGRLDATKDPTLKFFTFDSELQPVASPKELAADACRGSQTDLVGALGRLVERYHSSGKRLRGIVVLTDGRQIPSRPADDVAMEIRATHSPVYPVIMGEAVKTIDLAVSTRRQQYIAFQGQPFTISAHLKCIGLENIQPKVTLLDHAGTVLAEKQVTIGRQPELDVPFEIKAAPAGYTTYRLRVEAWPGESMTANNTAEFAAYALRDKMRVLLVEGTPYWDSKFIAQLLQRQQNVNLSLVYRLSQDRYFSQMDTNLLSADQAWRALPDSVEALARYDLIVAGRGFEYFLNRDNISALKEFLLDRGGGLIFTRGKPYAGEQPELEPLEPVSWGPEWSQSYVWQPTVTGEESGLFSEGLPGRNDPIWARLPPLSHAWQATRPKLFAQVLAEGVSQAGGRSNRVPVLVSQRFGRGQVVVVNSDDLWQWDFFPKFEGAGNLYRDFWLHLITWAVVDAEFLPGHDWAMHLSDHVTDAGQPVRVRVASRQPRKDQEPVVRVWQESQMVTEIPVAAVPDKAGEYEGMLSLAQPGIYRLEASLRSSPQPLVYETFTIKPPPAEGDDVSPDREWLTGLASATEGAIVAESELPRLFQPPPVTEESITLENAQWISAWDSGLWLVVVVALFAIEWVIRRRNGLI